MAVVLLIETATPVCSVAISKDHQILSIRESGEKNIHSSLITVFVQEVMKEADIPLNNVDAIAISKGPGSYTGLRIGTSTAKGLCYALDKPLIALSTLESMAHGAADHVKQMRLACKEPMLLCPMIDARRMEVYTAIYNESLNEIKGTSAEIITGKSFESFFEDHCLLFFGNGADKCKEVFIDQPKAICIDDFLVSSRHMIQLAEEALSESHFEDLAYFEPFYLKDFIAGPPKVKGLN